MHIQKLSLHNFGKFHEKDLEFSEGINMIYGKNEAGKTTIHTFIKGMFYGLERLRGRAAGRDEYNRYKPWKHTAVYEGSMKFEAAGKEFLLKRDFSKGAEGAELLCLTDGERFSIEHGDLIVLLDGMTKSAFTNTVSIGQLRSATEDSLADELRNYITNFCGGQDARIDVVGALKDLKEQKKQLERQKKQLDSESEQALSGIYVEQEYMEKECREKEDALAKKEKEEEDLKKPSFWGAMVAFAVTLTAFFLCRGLFPDKLFLLCLPAVMGVLFLCILYTNIRRYGIYKKESWEISYYRRQAEDARKELDIRKEEIQEEHMVLLEQKREEIRDVSGKIQALNLATSTIEDISMEIQKETKQELQDYAGNILKEITKGAYEKVFLDEQLRIQLGTREGILDLSKVSRGCMEQVYFAVRMAIADFMFPDAEFPILLDDTFALYDDERLGNTLEWLAKQKRQVLLFTCHKREQEIMLLKHIPFHSIGETLSH